METVQYFKIHSVLGSISELYETLFKQRMSDIIRKSNISSGILQDNVNILSDIGGNFKEISNNILDIGDSGEVLDKQNITIKSIADIYDNLNHITLKLSNEKYIEIKEKLIYYLIQVHSFIEHDTSSSDELEVREQIELKLETLQLNVDECSNNNESEIQANEMKELGNKQFKDGKFDDSIGSFQRALVLNEGLSNLTKSILYSNKGLAKLSRHALTQKNKTDNYEKVTVSLEDYFDITFAHEDVMKSIELRPSWFKPYYLLAKIRSKLSNYQQSINLCDASLYLLLSSPPPNLTVASISSMKLEIERIKLDSIKKLNQFVINENGERDFKQESINKIDNDLLNTLFDGKSITNEFIIQHGLDKLYKMGGEKLKYERLSITKAIEYETKGYLNDAYEMYSTLISCKTQYSFAYYTFATFLATVYQKYINNNSGSGKPLNNTLFISLLLKVVTMKLYARNEFNVIDIDSLKFNCSTYSRTCCLLGTIYKNGLFGQDIDIDKSIYYFSETIKYTENNEENGYDGYAHYVLAFYNYNGVISNQSILSTTHTIDKSLEKTKDYVLRGVKLGSELCKKFLNNLDNLSTL